MNSYFICKNRPSKYTSGLAPHFKNHIGNFFGCLCFLQDHCGHSKTNPFWPTWWRYTSDCCEEHIGMFIRCRWVVRKIKLFNLDLIYWVVSTQYSLTFLLLEDLLFYITFFTKRIDCFLSFQLLKFFFPNKLNLNCWLFPNVQDVVWTHLAL